MPQPIPASFWRGGTSRGILFRARDLAPLPMSLRNRVLLSAMGSPDPDGRQIDGLGGGVSSLSKVGVFSSPGEGVDLYRPSASSPDPSYLWPDARPDLDSPASTGGWDVIYRFAQVPVRTTTVDWASTCGNMISAVACAAVSDPSSPIIPYASRIAACRPFRSLGFVQGKRTPVMMPIRIALGNTGDVVGAKVPLDPVTMQLFEPRSEEEGFRLAGVPGVGAPVELRFPLAKEGQLPTGRAKDVLRIAWGGQEVDLEVTIASTGLVNVFVPATSLADFSGLPTAAEVLNAHPAELDSHPKLGRFMEEVRKQCAVATGFEYEEGTGEPKVSVVGRGGADGEDLRIRAVSVGNFHRTVPSTTLSALAVAASHPTSVVPTVTPSSDGVMTLRARHAAGVAEATLQIGADGGAESVVMIRTAREIMRGQVMIPDRAFAPE